MSLRIGSLFTGTGALDLAVMEVFDAEVVWHSQYEPPDKHGKEDKNQYAARILARHWPAIPNLGDITKVCWLCVLAEYGPVNGLIGGFPCTDVSSAGQRAGLAPGTRSGLWSHFAHAISILQPEFVVIENVEGLLSAPADRGLEPGTQAVDESPGTGRILRALGAVLGDLAGLGFHAEWACVAASEVGAPHRRKRIIIYAWRAALDPRCLGRGDGSRILGGLGAAGRDAEAVADADSLRRERHRPAGQPAQRHPQGANCAPAHATGEGRQGPRPKPEPWGGPQRGDTPTPADAHSVEPERRGVARDLGSQAATEPGEGDQRKRAGHTARDSSEALSHPEGERLQGHPYLARGEGQIQRGPHADGCGEAPAHSDGRRCEGNPERHSGPHGEQPERQRGLDPVGRGAQRATPADTTGHRRDERRAEPARQQGGPDAAERRLATLNLRPGTPDVEWGAYGPAIRRWERILGRPAPWPTDALGRLSPVFTEWLMGLPDGWVTNTPTLTRSAMLRALGNGVVPQQADAALRMLHARAHDSEAAA